MLSRLTISSLKQLFRNKQALFWSLVFPLLFAFIFGSFFGDNSINAGTIAIVNKSNSELAKGIESAFTENEAFKVNKLDNIDDARNQLRKSDIVAIIDIPENFGAITQNQQGLPVLDTNVSNEVKIIADPGSAQTSSLIVGIVDKILANATLQIQGAKSLFSVKQESSSTRNLTYFDFILAGLIGLSLMNSAVQGMAISIAKYRDEKILKRITTTPLAPWKFVVAEVLSHLVLNFIQVTLLLVIGVYVFHAHIYGNIFIIYSLALLGAVLFLALGFVVAAIAKTSEAAEGMATAVTVPMMFLGGVFFPLDSLPKWMFSIVQFVPLAPLLRMIRSVTLDAASPFTDIKNFIIVLAWIAILLIVASWRFKFSEE